MSINRDLCFRSAVRPGTQRRKLTFFFCRIRGCLAPGFPGLAPRREPPTGLSVRDALNTEEGERETARDSPFPPKINRAALVHPRTFVGRILTLFSSLSLSLFIGAAMVNIHGRRCHQQGCDKQPTFGRKGQKASRLGGLRACSIIPRLCVFYHWHVGHRRKKRERDNHDRHPHTHRSMCFAHTSFCFSEGGKR